MADKVVTFGSDAVGFGTLTGWAIQSSSVVSPQERANTLGPTGNESVMKLYGDTTEVTTTYKATVTGSAPTIPASIGALTNGYIITSINVSTSPTDFATMTLTGHNHTNNAHAADPALNSVAHSITLDDGFGVTDFLGGTAGDNASPMSSSITITCDHQDREDESGDHFVGENYNPRMEASTTWTGDPSANNADGTWDITSDGTDQGNTDFLGVTVSGTKELAFS